MHKVQSVLGRIAMLLIVIVLIAVAFWLVARQAQPGSHPTAQDTDRLTPPPATPQPTILPTPLPTATPTAPLTATTSPSPAHTPFTPEVIFGKGSLVTAPPPTPTTGPGPLAAYRLSDPTYIPLSQNGHPLQLLGFSADGSRLLTYHLPEEPTQPALLTSFALSDDLSGQAIETQTLALDAARLEYVPGYPALQRLGDTDHLIYRETLADGLYAFTVSNLQGQDVSVVGQATSPKFTTSNSGIIAYVKQGEIIIQAPLQNNAVLAQLRASDYEIDVNHFYFGLALAPQADHLAVYDDNVFKVIELASFQATMMPVSFGEPVQETRFEAPEGLGRSYIQTVLWSPTGKQIYFEQTPVVQLPSFGTAPYFIDRDGQNKIGIPYGFGSDDPPMHLFGVQWFAAGEVLVAIASPHHCAPECQDRLMFISNEGQYFHELLRQESIRLIHLSGDNQKLVYNCILPDVAPQQGAYCITEILY